MATQVYLGEPDVATKSLYGRPLGRAIQSDTSLYGRPLGRDIQSVESLHGRPLGRARQSAKREVQEGSFPPAMHTCWDGLQAGPGSRAACSPGTREHRWPPPACRRRDRCSEKEHRWPPDRASQM